MLSRLFTPAVEERAQATTWGTWPGDNGGTSAPIVNDQTALKLLAVLGCVQLITDSISTLPVDVYREDAQGVKTEIPSPVWITQPTVDLDFVSWCSQVVSSLVLHGNSFCNVTRNARNEIVELLPLDPTLVSVVRTRQQKTYIVNGREYPFEIMHIPGLMLPGAVAGLDPLMYARESVGLGLQAQEFASNQFGADLNLPGVIEIPKRAQPEQMQAMAQAWRKARTKRGRGLPGVLEDGATWKPTGISNEAGQFLQSRQWSSAEICAQLYLIDPRELGIPLSGSTLDYTNGETRKAELLTKGLLRWMIRIEKALSALMPMTDCMKFNVDGFLRGDSAARWATYATAMTINAQAAAIGQPPVLLTSEMRDFEDLNYIEEYPGATMPADTADHGTRDLSTAEAIQKIYLGVGTVITADEAREIVNAMTGTNLKVPAPDLTPAARADDQPVEQRDPVVVNVTNHVPEVRAPDVHVHNEPAAVSVDVHPQTINVPGAEVRVNVDAPESKTTTRTIERDADGRILKLIDEVN